MPFEKSIYPGWWPQFSLYIRNERAGGRCEMCDAINGEYGRQGRDGIWRTSKEIDQLHDDLWERWYSDGKPETKVVLTVAHLDFEGGICDCKERTGFKCARPDHVLALCQKDHLALDMPKHIERRRKTLQTRNDAARPLFGL